MTDEELRSAIELHAGPVDAGHLADLLELTWLSLPDDLSLVFDDDGSDGSELALGSDLAARARVALDRFRGLRAGEPGPELKPYDVTLTLRSVVRTFLVRSESPEQAVVAALRASPETVKARWRPEAVGDLEVVGQCEACEVWLLDGTDYASDDEGCLLCLPCATECAEAKGERLRERGL